MQYIYHTVYYRYTIRYILYIKQSNTTPTNYTLFRAIVLDLHYIVYVFILVLVLTKNVLECTTLQKTNGIITGINTDA